MSRLTDFIIGDTKTNDKRNFIWNMFGSGIFSFISMFMSICVIFIMGEEAGGIFSIAITISQMFLYIAYFEQRTYQVTDYERKYTFAQYHGAKIITCIMMLVISFGYIIMKQYPSEKAEIILLMCVFRMLDGYADLYEGQFQLEERLYLSGKSMAFRSVFSFLCLMLGLIITHDMKKSLYIAIVAAMIGVLVCDICVAWHFDNIRPDFSFIFVINILKECFPLFVGAFLWVYILSASRIAVDGNMNSEFVAYYQVLFMPVSIINLFATFFFRPALTEMSELYNQKNKSLLVRKIRSILILILSLTIVCMIGAYLMGIPVLSILSGCNLNAYRNSLVILMLAGGINSAAFFMYYVLSITRNMKCILFGYVTAALISILISGYFVRKIGILGASLSFLISVSSLFLIFVISILIDLKKMGLQNNECSC